MEWDENMEIWEKYLDLWMKKVNSRPALSGQKPIVFFLDGQGVTRHHRNLLKEMPRRLTDAAAQVAEQWKIDCYIYAFLDELSVVIPTPAQMIRQFRIDREASHLRELFLQRLLPLIQTHYPGLFFWIDVFEIELTDIDRYIQYRREFCYSGALFQFAKEHFEKKEYRDLTLPQVEELLKSRIMPGTIKSYLDFLQEHKTLTDGIYIEKRFSEQSALDILFELQGL